MTSSFSRSRRRFVTGLASTTAISLLNSGGYSQAAQSLLSQTPNSLNGRKFNLDIGYMPVNFTGKNRQATAINGTIPAPTLRWKEGDRVSLMVRTGLVGDSFI